MSGRFRCAIAAAQAAEPRYATASTVRRWLLVEQPGPWGADAIRESRMPRKTADALVELSRQVPARLVVIRRCGGRPAQDGCTVLVAFSGARSRWLERFTVDAPADVLDFDLGALRRGGSVGGDPVRDPALLVCTNGRHDPCCAEFGRPVATALDAAFGDRVWEVSHIGGDRFAGNLVTLPDGLYFGGLDPHRALATAQAHREGRITLDTYRGRSALPFPVQAAEYFLRQKGGWDTIDDVQWTAGQRLGDGEWRATFDTPDGAMHVDVAVGREPMARQLTCRAAEPARPPQYDLLGIHRD